MALRRTAARILSTFLATVLVLGAVRTPGTAATDFVSGVKKAFSLTFPYHSLREKSEMMAPSELRADQRVRIASATFAAAGSALNIVRAVGAVRDVTRAPSNGKVIAVTPLSRPGAGIRHALVISTADHWGPGLTILSWSERVGVSYQIAARGAVGDRDLVRLARALPKDSSQVTKAARAAIAGAEPPAPPDVDRLPAGSATAQGTGNRIVDGARTTQDDFGDEANLCAGCSYWHGNWAGMWQTILWADGKLARSGIDCQFGSTTAAATRAWQRSKNLADDGIVGPDSRGKADNYLHGYEPDFVDYLGDVQTPHFHRSTTTGYYYLSGRRITYSLAGGTLPDC